jgi:sucrose-6-phosphate hydrolase SacC (GH32 family)
LGVDGDKNETRWIFYGGSGDYYIGDFDGKKFTPETGKLKFNYGNCFYASQTFNNMPDERCVQIAWGQCQTPGMPFNQMMLFPVTLTLGNTGDGLRMLAWPIEEIKSLYGEKISIRNRVIKEGQNPLKDVKGDQLDIKAEVEVGSGEFGFTIYGKSVVYNAAENVLKCSDKQAKIKPVNGKLRLRLLVDRTSLEIFVNDGQVYMPIKVLLKDRVESGVEFFTDDAVKVKSMTVHQLKSIWR